MRLIVKDQSSRTVIASGVVGDTALIHEDNWYFQPETVNLGVLDISERIYTCPYKGVCYWIDLRAPHTRSQNIAWVYRDPKPGYEAIKGMIGFYARGKSGILTECEPFANRDALDLNIEGDNAPR